MTLFMRLDQMTIKILPKWALILYGWGPVSKTFLCVKSYMIKYYLLDEFCNG